jgi:hypothetical protein
MYDLVKIGDIQAQGGVVIKRDQAQDGDENHPAYKGYSRELAPMHQ